MNTTTILNYVDTMASSITKEVFSAVVCNKSQATRNAAKGAAIAAIKKINSSLTSDPIAYIASMEVETVLAFASEWSLNESKTWRYRLVITPFKPLWAKFMGFMYDLNSERILEAMKGRSQAYYDMGDGLLLAGLYLLCNEGK